MSTTPTMNSKILHTGWYPREIATGKWDDSCCGEVDEIGSDRQLVDGWRFEEVVLLLKETLDQLETELAAEHEKAKALEHKVANPIYNLHNQPSTPVVPKELADSLANQIGRLSAVMKMHAYTGYKQVSDALKAADDALRNYNAATKP